MYKGTKVKQKGMDIQRKVKMKKERKMYKSNLMPIRHPMYFYHRSDLTWSHHDPRPSSRINTSPAHSYQEKNTEMEGIPLTHAY